MEYLGKNFIHSIECNMHHFTKTETILAKFIVAHPHEFAEMSINEVAGQLGISQATITRFCQKLSYTGFNEFRYELKRYNELQGGVSSDREAESSDQLLSIHHDYTDVIDKTIAVNNVEVIQDVVEYMKAAKKIRIYGVGKKGTAALEFKRRFLPLNLNIDACTEHYLVRMDAGIADENTVIFVLSMSGESKELQKSIEIAKKSGAKIISITENPHSPLGKLSDFTLLAANKENMHMGHNISSLLPFLLIMDLLYTQLVMSDYKKKMYVLDQVNNALID